MATIQKVDKQNILIGDNPPPLLGKFFDANGVLASIDAETVKFTPPNELNDCFDCVPGSYKMADIEKAWQNNPWSRYWPDLKNFFTEEIRQRSWESFRQELSRSIGVASFTDVTCCDKEWMWNRYGDQHRGALVLYDTSVMGIFIKVQYRDSRPLISIPEKTESYPPEDVIAVFRTKERNTNEHWEKECEWRKINRLSALNEVTTSKGIFYLKSYPNAFKMIECGREMAATRVNEITEKAASKGIQVHRET
jgi:hypothetical protein